MSASFEKFVPLLLRHEVKDIIYKEDQPKSLKGFMQRAQRISESILARKEEKQKAHKQESG